MAEYHKYYGYAPESKFEIKVEPKKQNAEASGKNQNDKPAEASGSTTESSGSKFIFGDNEYQLSQDPATKFYLYYSMMLFYQNGGGPCYIVSVGDYKQGIKFGKLDNGIKLLIKEQEPTMIVIPDAVLLKEDNCAALQVYALRHCGETMKNRVAILDVYKGYKERTDTPDCINQFRDKIQINFLDYGAAYYPWVRTSIVQDSDLGFENFSDKKKLQERLVEELDIKKTDTEPEKEKKGQQEKTIKQLTETKWEEEEEQAKAQGKLAEFETKKLMLNKSLVAMSPFFKAVLKEFKRQLNLLPPSAAMAGIYTMVDNARGVWKAPANVSLSSVVSPAVSISHEQQQDLNVTPTGKSINAIRTFIGEGTLVWGARTLDGNSLDWRYINVRRTLIMLEESIKLAAKAYVFEDNVATTWATINSMITNFLTGIWKRGGLAGTTPQDAFSVFVGLGETMTPEDILEGILRVTVLVAPVRPAEFIEITFQQQMQKS